MNPNATNLARTPLAGRRAALLWLAVATFFSGCHEDSHVPADRLEIVSGNNQAQLTGQLLGEPLVVRALGKRSLDLLGRKKARIPAAGVPVTFELDAPTTESTGTIDEPPANGGGGSGLPAGAAGGPEGKPTPSPDPVLLRGSNDQIGRQLLVVNTDEDGLARVFVQLGTGSGGWNVEADIVKRGERIRFSLVSGVRKFQSHTENVIGGKVDLSLSMAEPAGDERIPVHQVVYRVVGEPPGAGGPATLKNPRDRTDPGGLQRAPTELTLGDRPGVYQVLAEISSDAPGGTGPESHPFRGIVFHVVAMDWIRIGLWLASGLLLFVLGVRLLGSGVLLLTGDHMERAVASWSQNRGVGYLGGALCGFAFQSSSLVTSHLSSLANGGLLTSARSVGILAGAAAGGTILTQILALELGSFAAPCLLAGILVIVLRGRSHLRPWAWVFLGVGLILLGWNLLRESIELAALSETLRTEVLLQRTPADHGYPAYAANFLAYCAIGGAAGFLLRTSNLLVVVAMMLALQGVISATAAVPIVLGANLGAAVMVFLLTRGKRREARSVALVAVGLQLFGFFLAVVLSLVVINDQPAFLHLVDALTPGQLQPLNHNPARHVAMAHTLHNVFAGLIGVILSKRVLRLGDRLLPTSSVTEVKPHRLDPQLVTVPSLALRQATAEVIYLSEVGRKTVAEAFDAFRYSNLDLAEQVIRRAETTTAIYQDLGLFLVEVSQNQLTRANAHQIDILQSAAESQLRIGELAERLRDLASRRIEEKIEATEEIDRDLGETYDLVVAQFGNIIGLLRQRDARAEEQAAKMVERLAKFSTRVEAYWERRLQQAEGPNSPLELHLQTIIYQEAFSILFRVAAELGHVAQRMRLFTP